MIRASAQANEAIAQRTAELQPEDLGLETRRLMTVSEAAEYLGRTPSAVRQLIAGRCWLPDSLPIKSANTSALAALMPRMLPSTANWQLCGAVSVWLLGEDPPIVRRAPYILKLEEDNARPGFIEQPQYMNLCSALPDHLNALFVVGYHCGNRLGEIGNCDGTK